MQNVCNIIKLRYVSFENPEHMRKSILVLFIMLMCASCNHDTRFVLDGTLTNIPEGEMICLLYPVKRGDVWYEEKDTAYVADGRFRFEGNVDGCVPACLWFPNMDEVSIFIEPNRLTFSAERNRLYNYTLSGLSIDSELAEYRQVFAEYNKTIYEKHYEIMRKNEEWIAAVNAESEEASKLFDEFSKVAAEYHAIADTWPAMAVEYIDTHPDDAIVPFIIDCLITIDYDSVTIDSYVNRLSSEQRNSILGELMSIRNGISKLNGGKVGSNALDFMLMSNDGSREPLSNYYADGYVLLDFWASWCRPCIGEIPKLRELHSNYGDKIQIVSLSIDEDEALWREALTQHNLVEWPQFILDRSDDAQEHYFSEQGDMSMAYDVEYIPCFILIDNRGVIVGRWTHLTPETISEIESLVVG